MTVENKVFCLVGFILMNWVVGKNSTWPSRHVQMVGWSKALPVPEP